MPRALKGAECMCCVEKTIRRNDGLWIAWKSKRGTRRSPELSPPDPNLSDLQNHGCKGARRQGTEFKRAFLRACSARAQEVPFSHKTWATSCGPGDEAGDDEIVQAFAFQRNEKKQPHNTTAASNLLQFAAVNRCGGE